MVRRHIWGPSCITFRISLFCEYFVFQHIADHKANIFICRFGPNTFPAFNSVIFSVEVQVEYIAKTLISPILDRYADVIEVKPEAEEKFIDDLDGILEHTVFSAGCSNWYINSAGRNSASWPGLASTFWKAAMFPKWKDFETNGGSRSWAVRRAIRSLRNSPLWAWLVFFSLVGTLLMTQSSLQPRGLHSLLGR